MDTKFQVFYHRGKAHLSEGGHKTFCGESISRPSGFMQSQPATLNEFIEEVRPRCSKCRFNAEMSIVIVQLAKAME